MKKALMVIAVALWMAPPAFAADKTWNGTISDTNCKAKHATAEEHGAKMTKADCVKACVDEHGALDVLEAVRGGDFHQHARWTVGACPDNAGVDRNIARLQTVGDDGAVISAIE